MSLSLVLVAHIMYEALAYGLSSKACLDMIRSKPQVTIILSYFTSQLFTEDLRKHLLIMADYDILNY